MGAVGRTSGGFTLLPETPFLPHVSYNLSSLVFEGSLTSRNPRESAEEL